MVYLGLFQTGHIQCHLKDLFRGEIVVMTGRGHTVADPLPILDYGGFHICGTKVNSRCNHLFHLRNLSRNVVFSTYCRNCHGTMGEGDTEYGEARGLEVPSLVEPDWRWAQARDSVLHRIYVGHAQGMPTWGVAGISLREMDAVTSYLLEVLRPEVLDAESGA